MSASLVANPVDATALADELARYRVVDADQLSGLLAEFHGDGAGAFADFLVQRGAISAFQAERALAGESSQLVLGPYRLAGGAGRGTFGPLFSATHTTKPGAFTIRTMPLRSLWKARQAKQLARALAVGEAHPVVIPLIEVDSANGLHYLVWSQTDGVRLSDYVDGNGPLLANDVIAMLRHMASALAAYHTRGVVHGALTPSCVAIGTDGRPRILELGAGTLLAQNLDADESLFDSMSAAFASASVLTFAAPELAVSPLAPTPACDQYALGTVCYFALTGLSPYPHPALAEQLRAKRNGPPPSVAIVNPDVPRELAAVLDRMMAPAPGARFPSLRELEEALAELALTELTPVEQPSVEPLLSRLQKRSGEVSKPVARVVTGSGTLRPAARDDSDASISFDLPEATELAPETDPVPRLAQAETLPSGKPFDNDHTPSPVFAPSSSPAHSGDQDMANRLLGAPNGGGNRPDPPPDPRLSVPNPVQWQAPAATSGAPQDQPSGVRKGPAPVPAEQYPPAHSLFWKRLRRNLLFWKPPRDTVQVSVFGPAAATPGQTVRLTLFLHQPDAVDNVRTLSRVFQKDAELVGTGYLMSEVVRAAELSVHVSVSNAGISRTMMKFQWRGQPQRLGFDLHIPWESAEGWLPGLVSIGLEDVRVGKIEFWLNVPARKA